jgi:hypothetical protein
MWGDILQCKIVVAYRDKHKSVTYAKWNIEPYAMKVARTVLMGGKSVRIYLSNLKT